MKIKLIFTTLFLILTLSACSLVAPAPPAPQPAPQPSSELPENPPSEKISYPEDEMPTNTPEDQEYLDKYIIPYAVTSVFRRNFNADDYSELSDHLFSLFATFVLNDPNNTILLTDAVLELPAATVESTLMAHFNITPEFIRESAADLYYPESQTYNISSGLGGGPAEFVVTSSSLEGDILTLSYDFYTGDSEDTSDVFHYMLTQQGIVVIEINGEAFKYISNTIINDTGF